MPVTYVHIGRAETDSHTSFSTKFCGVGDLYINLEGQLHTVQSQKLQWEG
jgi:hypothetical protein